MARVLFFLALLVAAASAFVTPVNHAGEFATVAPVVYAAEEETKVIHNGRSTARVVPAVWTFD
jgi:hypothetical protein